MKIVVSILLMFALALPLPRLENGRGSNDCLSPFIQNPEDSAADILIDIVFKHFARMLNPSYQETGFSQKHPQLSFVLRYARGIFSRDLDTAWFVFTNLIYLVLHKIRNKFPGKYFDEKKNFVSAFGKKRSLDFLFGTISSMPLQLWENARKQFFWEDNLKRRLVLLFSCKRQELETGFYMNLEGTIVPSAAKMLELFDHARKLRAAGGFDEFVESNNELFANYMKNQFGISGRKFSSVLDMLDSEKEITDGDNSTDAKIIRSLRREKELIDLGYYTDEKGRKVYSDKTVFDVLDRARHLMKHSPRQATLFLKENEELINAYLFAHNINIVPKSLKPVSLLKVVSWGDADPEPYLARAREGLAEIQEFRMRTEKAEAMRIDYSVKDGWPGDDSVLAVFDAMLADVKAGKDVDAVFLQEKMPEIISYLKYFDLYEKEISEYDEVRLKLFNLAVLCVQWKIMPEMFDYDIGVFSKVLNYVGQKVRLTNNSNQFSSARLLYGYGEFVFLNGKSDAYKKMFAVFAHEISHRTLLIKCNWTDVDVPYYRDNPDVLRAVRPFLWTLHEVYAIMAERVFLNGLMGMDRLLWDETYLAAARYNMKKMVSNEEHINAVLALVAIDKNSSVSAGALFRALNRKLKNPPEFFGHDKELAAIPIFKHIPHVFFVEPFRRDIELASAA